TYHWMGNGTNLIDSAHFSGSQSNNLTITNVQMADAGPYQVVVSNNFGAVTSSVATLTVVTRVAESVTWSAPAGITYGTPLSASQLNATSSVPGTFTYNFTNG